MKNERFTLEVRSFFVHDMYMIILHFPANINNRYALVTNN